MFAVAVQPKHLQTPHWNPFCCLRLVLLFFCGLVEVQQCTLSKKKILIASGGDNGFVMNVPFVLELGIFGFIPDADLCTYLQNDIHGTTILTITSAAASVRTVQNLDLGYSL